ncbi:MAG TPA: sialidase family protein, partial [Blastocatellia bacterium]|nr:sialidase family protein [Blastocatellia bacterium]
LIQDDKGTFHLTWFRWQALFRGHIWYNSSPDGITWDQTNERQVTTGDDVDDWVPTITEMPDGTLLVFFVSAKRDRANPTNDIYLATRSPNEVTWKPAVRLSGISSAALHDHLPFATRNGDKITLIWDRYDTTEAIPWLNRKSDLFYSTSGDGLTWSAPVQITDETGDVVNLFPAIYFNHGGEAFVTWLSTRSGQPRLFDLPLAGDGQSGIKKNKRLKMGYSHRIAATSTPGIYIGVWVEGPEGAQDIYYRFFKKK